MKRFLSIALVALLFAALTLSPGQNALALGKKTLIPRAQPQAQTQTRTPPPAQVESQAQSNIPATAAPKIIKGSESQIDIGNKDNGTIRAAYLNATSKPLKVKIVKTSNGQETGNYVYDLNNQGRFETYPLQMGDGSYTIKVLRQISGNTYAVVQTQSVNVTLGNKNAPYLVATQLVNYTSESSVTKKAAELCQGKTTDLDKVTAIYQYIVKNITYDKQKASDVVAGKLNGYIPNVDVILTSNKGICFDYSSVLGAMLRSQGIPTKLIMGYVAPNNVYHAWNEVYIQNVGWVKINSQVYFDGKTFSRMDSTFAAGNSSGSQTAFISNNGNYAKQSEY